MIPWWDRQTGRIWLGDRSDNVSRILPGCLGSKGSDEHYKVQLQLVNTALSRNDSSANGV